ncbi:MAG: LysR family transcriptional regulator [Pseudomonadota bacterium]
MDTLVSMRVFRQVVERGSFIGAAGQLGISTAMASKHVAHLEQHLGSRLLNRTSRHVSLTEAGAVYYEQCRDALDTLELAAASLSGSVAEPSGVLKVTAPVWCANAAFAATLAGYKEKYPKVVLDLRLTNWRVDLAEGGFDLALRASVSEVPTMIVRPICPIRFLFVATPAYLKKHGPLNEFSQMGSHGAVLPSYIKTLQQVAVEGPAGKAVINLPVAMKSDDSTLSHQSILAGIGFGYLPEWLVADDLATGRLQRVLTEFSITPGTLYATYTSRKYLTPKVRTFIDFLTESLAGA